MKPNLQLRVQRYGWDKAAAFYEDYWARQLEPAQELLLDIAALESGERVLDVACGTGLLTFPAAAVVGTEGHVMATDLSAEMVATTRDAAARLGLGQVAVERMGAEQLSLEEAMFDAAICGLGLMYVPSPVEALKEMKRVLKDSGRAVASVWGSRANCGWAEIFPIVDARVSSEVCPMFFQLGTGRAMEYAFNAAGYSEIETERISTVLEYDSEEDALGAAFAGGPVALAYARFDDSVRDEAHAEYLASIAPFRKGDGYEIPGEFVVTRGRKT